MRGVYCSAINILMNTNQNGFIACGSQECECMGRGHRTAPAKRERCKGCQLCNGIIECYNTAPKGKGCAMCGGLVECAACGTARGAALKATRCSPFEADHQCEHGDGQSCERRAAAWTMQNGSGYVVACSMHAQELLDDAIAAGDIYPMTESA